MVFFIFAPAFRATVAGSLDGYHIAFCGDRIGATHEAGFRRQPSDQRCYGCSLEASRPVPDSGATALRLPVPTFVPVRITPPAVIELVLPTGVVVRVPSGAEPAAVARLVTALGAAPC